MFLVPVILLLSFTLWTIFSEGNTAILLRSIFLLSFIAWIWMIISRGQNLITSFPLIAFSFLLIAAYGFIIQNIVTKNIGRVVIAALAISPFIYWKQHVNQMKFFHSFIYESNADRNEELIIRCKENKVDFVKSNLSEMDFVNRINNWEVIHKEKTDLDNYLIIDVDDTKFNYEVIKKIGSIPGVEWIEENESWNALSDLITTPGANSINSSLVNDPKAKDQWNFQLLELDKFHRIINASGIKPKKPAKLFILDSGVNFKHEDLKDVVISHNSVDKTTNETDINGHGTHCAGVAAAKTNNGIGVASFNPGPQFVSVYSVAALNRFGIATQSRIIDAIIQAVDAGADVISMSLGSLSNQLSEEAYEEVFEYAQKNNVILVAAAGNSNAGASKYVPSGRNEVITVTAINKYKEKAQFSNYIQNTNFGIAAPGTSILSTYKNKYATFDGTSMAAPHVAGLVAVLRSIRPKLTTSEAFKILNDTGENTIDVSSTGKLINPTDALKEVMD